MEKIRICNNHQNYPTPLIWTFAFSGAEYWCPYCGKQEGMLGAGELVENTGELKKREEAYKKLYREYCHAHGVTSASLTEWEGKDIPPSELPEEEKNRLAKIRQLSWKPNIKVEDVKKAGIVCDDWKLKKFEEELIEAGFVNYELFPFTNGTTTIQVNTTTDNFGHIKKICEDVEAHFRHKKAAEN